MHVPTVDVARSGSGNGSGFMENDDMAEDLNRLVDDYQERRVDRRGFMQQAAALGLSSSAIAALAGLEGASAQSAETGPGGGSIAGGNVLAQLSEAMTQAVERAGAGTVTVYARRRMPGSGIVWSSDGLI